MYYKFQRKKPCDGTSVMNNTNNSNSNNNSKSRQPIHGDGHCWRNFDDESARAHEIVNIL